MGAKSRQQPHEYGAPGRLLVCIPSEDYPPQHRLSVCPFYLFYGLTRPPPTSTIQAAFRNTCLASLVYAVLTIAAVLLPPVRPQTELMAQGTERVLYMLNKI